MNQPVEIVAHEGVLYVRPPIPELQEALRFYNLRMKTKEMTYFCRKAGKEVTKKVQDGYGGEMESLCSVTEDGGYLVTHEGLFHRVADVLTGYGFQYTYRRTSPLPEFEFGPHVVAPMWSNSAQAFLPMYPEQIQAVIHALAATGCGQKGGKPPLPGSAGALIDSTMSTGKTFMIAAMIRAFQDHKIIITTYRSSVVRRLYDGLNEALGPEGKKIGIVMGGVKSPMQYTVCTDAMLQDFDPEETRVLLYDEVHRGGADGTSRDLLAFKKAVKIGFSGTIEKHKRKLYIESIFGPVAYRITDQMAEELNRVSNVKCYALSVPQGPDVANRTPTIRERHGITNNKFRNEIIASVARAVPEDMQFVLYVRTIEHIDVLMEHFLPPGFAIYHAQLGEREKKTIEKGIYDGSIKRLVANSSFSEGVDTTKMRVLMNADWTVSDQVVSQRGGRNRRKDEGKLLGLIIDLLDDWGEIKRLEAVKHIKDMMQEVPDSLEKPDPMFKKAKSRLKQYKDRGWPVVEIDSVAEIDFSEVNESRPEETEEVQAELHLG